MAEANASATDLSSIFSAGSSGPEPSKTPEKEKDESPVPASTEDTSSPDKKDEVKKPKKDKLPDDSSKEDTPPADKKKDSPADKGEKKDKPADKDASKTYAPESKDAPDKEEASKDDPFEKRWKDTAKAWNTEHQARLQLETQFKDQAKQLDQLKKQLADPDYDPEKDPQYAGPTPEEIAAASLMAGKALASRNAAYSQHGKEKVDAELAEFGQIYGKSEAIAHVIRSSENPVAEAMAIMDRHRFEKQYGITPAQIKENIRKEFETELCKTIRAELVAELREGKSLKDGVVKGLSDSRGGNGTDDSKSKGEIVNTPLGEIFSLNT